MRKASSGFTMLAVLAALTLLALSLQGVMWVVSTQTQREREWELLQVGVEIRAAIGRYVESSPGVAQQWPPSLEALLDDRRSVSLRRHLRRLYPDPLTRSTDWGIVRAPDGGVAGVFSRSDAAPVRNGGMDLAMFGVEPAAHYSQWRFVYVPPAREGATP